MSLDDFVWTVARDQYGFIVKTDDAAHSAIRSLMESGFGAPKFDSTGTLIFRNDQSQTTVMLHRNDGTTDLILLRWKDPAIRADMERQLELAIGKVVNDAKREIEELIANAELAPDDATKSSKIDKALRNAQEFVDAIHLMDTEPQN